jgi:hypothetical protein
MATIIGACLAGVHPNGAQKGSEGANSWRISAFADILMAVSGALQEWFSPF